MQEEQIKLASMNSSEQRRQVSCNWIIQYSFCEMKEQLLQSRDPGQTNPIADPGKAAIG
jgi:hypothetical protein